MVVAVIAPVLLLDQEALTDEHSVAVLNKAAAHRCEGGSGRDGSLGVLREGVEHGRREHVAGGTAQGVEVELHRPPEADSRASRTQPGTINRRPGPPGHPCPRAPAAPTSPARG